MVFFLAIGFATAEEPRQALPVKELKRKTPVDFEHELLPILKANCLACHNQTSSKGDLVLETPQTILKGGESGSAVTPGKPGESLLFQAASHQKRPSMPPKDNKVAATDLKPEELGLLKLWIEQGAKGEVRNAIAVEWGAMPGSLHPSYAVAITADGQFAACSRANQIAVYHLPSRQLVAKLKDKAARGAAHLDAVQSLDFNPDGTLLASSAFREVKFWSRKADSMIESLDLSSGIAELSTDGALMALSSSSNGIMIRDLRAKTNSASILVTNGTVAGLKFSPGQQTLAAIHENRSVSLCQVSQNAAFTNLALGATAFTWLSSNRFAVATASNAIEVWSLSSNLNVVAETNLPSQAEPITALAGTPDSLLIGDEKGVVRVRSVPSGKEIQKFQQESSLTSLGVSRDGRHYVSAGSNNVVKLWSAEGKLIAELKGDRFANEALAAAERKLTLAKGETTFQKSALQTAQKEHTNQLTRISKATATNEIADKLFSEKQKALETAKEAKIKLEKQLTGLQEELRVATNEVVVTKTNLPPATTEPPKETAATTITNKPAVAVGALQD